jgi:hypothetical protein
VNYGVEGRRRERSWPISVQRICLEGLTNITELLTRITLNSEPDSNPEPLEYEAGTLTSDLRFNKTKGNNSTIDKSENYIVLGLKCKPGLHIFFGFSLRNEAVSIT